MKFYVITTLDGETAGCEQSLRQAKALGRSLCGEFTVDAVEVAVNAETIRRLLMRDGEPGDLVISQRQVYPREARS
jgi:hypothetical protein